MISFFNRFAREKTLILFFILIILSIASCKKDVCVGIIPDLELNENDFYVDCVEIYGGAIGDNTHQFQLRGVIKNHSPFRVELRGAYHAASGDPWPIAEDGKIKYNYITNYFNFVGYSSKPTPVIYLDSGQEKRGGIIYIKEQYFSNIAASWQVQKAKGFFRVDAYPVYENNELIEDGCTKKYIISVPIPDRLKISSSDPESYTCPSDL